MEGSPAESLPVRAPGLDMMGLTAHCICRSNFKTDGDFHRRVLAEIKGPVQAIYGRDDFTDECLQLVQWAVVLRDASETVAVACMGSSFGVSFHGFWTAFEGVVPAHRNQKKGRLLFRVVEFVAQFMALNDPYCSLYMAGQADVAIRAHVDRPDVGGAKFMRKLGYVQTARDGRELTFVRRVPMLSPPSADP